MLKNILNKLFKKDEKLFIIKIHPMKILIDNGHGKETKGKRSPDERLLEYSYTREIADFVVNRLVLNGYDAEKLVNEDNDISLSERVQRVNKYCDELGKDNVLLVSIHCNAFGNGSEWLNATGWSAYTTKGQTKSDNLAEYLYKEATKNFIGQKIRIDKSDNDSDWEENFFILKNVYCPAVLTENFFMDNKKDVEYLLSKEGKESVIKTHVDGIVNYLKKV